MTIQHINIGPGTDPKRARNALFAAARAGTVAFDDDTGVPYVLDNRQVKALLIDKRLIGGARAIFDMQDVPAAPFPGPRCPAHAELWRGTASLPRRLARADDARGGRARRFRARCPADRRSGRYRMGASAGTEPSAVADQHLMNCSDDLNEDNRHGGIFRGLLSHHRS
jgi:hypothetical protein